MNCDSKWLRRTVQQMCNRETPVKEQENGVVST